jgi:predicted nucleotidyltransferase/predicted transcriptional regulator with HTH domain
MPVILNTKLRRKLLTYSFTHPDEDYYVRELSGLIDEDPGNLSRELRKLEEEGLFASFIRGRSRFYSLNKQYPLFKEIKKIVFKTEGVEGSLKEIMAKYRGISFAVIYGSYAKDKEKRTSDIDVVVVGRFPLDAFTRDIRNLESKLNREINFTAYTREEFEKERKKNGGFLNLVLKDKIVLLKGILSTGKTDRTPRKRSDILSRKEILKQLRDLKDDLRSRFSVKQIGLFGSYVHGEANEGSDIDLLVEFEESTFDHYMDLKFFLERVFQHSVDLVLAESVKPRLKPLITQEVDYA